MASPLGHSRKNKTLCSRAQTRVDHMGCPPCKTKGADHTHGNMPEPRMAGTDE